MTKLEEIWKDIPGFENHYQVSTHGHVRSLDGPRQKGKFTYSHNGRQLVIRLSIHGYYTVCLSLKGFAKLINVHRLVAKTFIENPLNKPYINHIDSDKTNNFVGNLEWCTPKENTQHIIKSGRRPPPHNKGVYKRLRNCERCGAQFNASCKYGVVQRFCGNHCKMKFKYGH